MIESGVGFVGEPPVLALDKDGKLDEQTLANLSLFLRSVAAALNGGLRVGPEGPPVYAGINASSARPAPGGKRAGNFSAQVCQFHFASAGVAYEIPHDLGRKPLGVIMLYSNAPTNLYGSNAPSWSTTVLQVISSAAGAYVTFLVV
jgi:hypothetical protein